MSALRIIEESIERIRAPCALSVQLAPLAGSDLRCCVDAANAVGRSIRKHDDPKAFWPGEGRVVICHGGILNQSQDDS